MAWQFSSLSVELGCSPHRAWSALTDPPTAAAWIGRLEKPIAAVGQELRLWVGPSDVYGVWVDDLAPPERLYLTMAHLYVENPTSLLFGLRPVGPSRTVVALTIGSCDRTPAHIARERMLWTERLDALARIVAGDTPYEHMDTFTLEARLPSPTWAALHPANLTRWIPLDVASHRRGFFIIDEDGPRRFPILSWRERYDEELTLDIGTGPQQEPTTACITAQSNDDHVSLRIVHNGWATLPFGGEEVLSLRGRFLSCWQEALRIATVHARAGRAGP